MSYDFFLRNYSKGNAENAWILSSFGWTHKEKVFTTRRWVEHASLVLLYPRRTSVSYTDFHFGNAIRDLHCCIHGKTHNRTLDAPAITYHSAVLLKWPDWRSSSNLCHLSCYKEKKNWAPKNSIRQVNGASVTLVEEVGQPMTDSQIMETVCPTVFSHLDH